MSEKVCCTDGLLGGTWNAKVAAAAFLGHARFLHSSPRCVGGNVQVVVVKRSQYPQWCQQPCELSSIQRNGGWRPHAGSRGLARPLHDASCIENPIHDTAASARSGCECSDAHPRTHAHKRTQHAHHPAWLVVCVYMAHHACGHASPVCNVAICAPFSAPAMHHPCSLAIRTRCMLSPDIRPRTVGATTRVQT